MIENIASEHAEKVLLGSVLLDSDRLLEIAETLSPGDFFLAAHCEIMAAMVRLAERGSTIDTMTLPHELAASKRLESVGGTSYIWQLTEGLPIRPEIDDYIAIVKDKALCRSLIHTSEVISAKAYANEERGLQIASWAAASIAGLVDQAETRVEIYDTPSMAADAEYRLCDNPQQAEVLPTGIDSLDEFTGGGLRLGELWIVGAAPSRGKTTIARQIALRNVRRGTPVYVQSGEMDKESWFDVTACLLENVQAWKTRQPQLMNTQEKETLRRGIRSLAELPLFISDTGSIQIDRLIWNATREKQRHNIKLLAVDYAQIVKSPGGSERDRIGMVADKLRIFAKEQQVAVLLLSQMSRPEGRSSNARPTMFMLKETGRLEEAAHTVILPFRPVDDAGAFTGEDELIVGKQRWGGIGSIPVTLNGKYLRFEER